jgi:hypothetical protein
LFFIVGNFKFNKQMKHTQLNQIDFSIAIKETSIFRKFENFKKGIVMKRKNTDRLHDYYQQAVRHGIDYLKQNPNIFGNDIAIIEEILNK